MKKTSGRKQARLAVIGCGGLAQSQHLPNMYKLDNAEISIICDVNRETLDKVGDCYGIERRVVDHREVMRDPGTDGVLIVTKPESHVPLTLEALAAGKHVYVEKPLAETESECARVTEAQARSGKIVAVGMNRRMAPAYRYAKALLAKQGGARNMTYRIADSYSLDWGKAYGPGNRLIHEACHVFDLLRYFTDSEVVSVYCIAARPDDEQVTLRFANDAVAGILCSGYVTSAMPKEHFEAVAGRGGVVVSDFAEVRQYSLDTDAPDVKYFAGHSHPLHDGIHEFLLAELGAAGMEAVRRVSWRAVERMAELAAAGRTDCAEYRRLADFNARAPLRNYFMDKGWRAALEDFAAAIQEGRDFQGARALDGLQAARITAAALESRTSGRPVPIE